jgi:hypothetical protein
MIGIYITTNRQKTRTAVEADMDAPIVSTVREVPTESASEGRPARAYISVCLPRLTSSWILEAWTFGVEKPSNPNTVGHLTAAHFCAHNPDGSRLFYIPPFCIALFSSGIPNPAPHSFDPYCPDVDRYFVKV